jgi:hypothetical protein
MQTDRSSLLSAARPVALKAAARLSSMPPLARWSTHRRQRDVIQHHLARRSAPAEGVIVADKTPTPVDVEIANRLLAAYRAAAAAAGAQSARGNDLWTMIAGQQSRFASILENGDPAELAAYLCNVSRHDASIGITQGEGEYRRIARDPNYRDFLALMAKDKLVSLAEAVGASPVENPEQGPYGVSIYTDLDELVGRISDRVGLDIAPPDIDGGLFKLQTDHGLFGERDANAIFTAWSLRNILRGAPDARICEIGGGSGRVAYWSRRLGRGPYTIVDLPHVNVVQGYYLLKSLPNDAVVLYGEQQPGNDAAFTVWPNHALSELPRTEFDLVLNQDSMPEMSQETVQSYLRWISDVCRGTFVSINHESKPEYGAGLAHVSVPETIHEIGGFDLRDRYPYWLRKGYVVEVYRTPDSGPAAEE